MLQLHLPWASYDFFVYDFRYDFSRTAEYSSMQTVRFPTTKRLPLRASVFIKMHGFVVICCDYRKIVSEYDQEIPQSQTADKLIAP